MTLNELNHLPEEQAASWFLATCAAQNWVESMVAARPFTSLEQLKSAAQHHWTQLRTTDYLEAFAAHPMIGDIHSLRSKFAHTKAMAANEQSGTAAASEATLEALRDYNLAYREKHGFIFIICASGLSADTMLEALKARLPNDTDTEIANAAEQQIRITLLRLEKNLQQETLR